MLPKNLIGLRASHFRSMENEGLSEEEIDHDWDQVEADLERIREEDLMEV